MPATRASADVTDAQPAWAALTAESDEPPPSGDRENVLEVDPVIVGTKRASQRPATHHPPPPPSIRAKGVTGGRARLDVAGDPKVAQDLMSRKIFTIGPEDLLENLHEHMQAFRFRHLPVVDGTTDKLVGLITQTDLLHASASFLVDKEKEQNAIIHKLPAKHVMRRELKTVRPSAPLLEVALLMWENKLGCVLVTEEDGALRGIITEADFLRLAHHFLQAKAAPSGS